MSYAKELVKMLEDMCGVHVEHIAVTEDLQRPGPAEVRAKVRVEAPGIPWQAKELRDSGRMCAWILRHQGPNPRTEIEATRVIIPEPNESDSVAGNTSVMNLLIHMAVDTLNADRHEQEAEHLRAQWQYLLDAMNREERLRQRGAVTNVAATITAADADSFREQLKRGQQIEREDAV